MALVRPRFATTKLVEGYDMAEVDDAIDRVFDSLAGDTPPMGADDVRALRFTPTRLRQGYTMGEVDDWLDLAAAELARVAAGGAPEADTATPAATTATTGDAAYAPATTRSDAIVRTEDRSTRVALAWGLAVVVVVLVLAAVL